MEQEQVLVSSNPKDLQTVYEGGILYLSTVTFGLNGPKLSTVCDYTVTKN